jgi:hypothetical protein
VKNGRADLSLAVQIYNRIRKLSGFDLGTKPKILGKPKLITLADALCNQKPSKLAQKFLVFEDWSKFEECQ